MARSLKFVVLGTTALEVEEFMVSVAASMNGAEISRGEVAASPVFRFSGDLNTGDGRPLRLAVYGASMETDFRGVFNLLVKNADGVLGLIPADFARVVESRKVLTALHRVLESRRVEKQNLPFVIQYQWPEQGAGPSPEELDTILGVNPEIVERCFSRVGDDARKGILVLAESLQRVKSSPK